MELMSFEEFKSWSIEFDIKHYGNTHFLHGCTDHDWDMMYKGYVRAWEASHEEG